MKKVVMAFILLISMPINIFAYSEEIIPGGENIGIKIHSSGLLVIGYYKVNNKYIAEDNIKISDKIIKIEGKNITIGSVGSLRELQKMKLIANKLFRDINDLNEDECIKLTNNISVTFIDKFTWYLKNS